MKTMIAGLVMAGLFAGTAAAAACPTDFDYVSPLGHDGRKASVAGLGAFFKAVKDNDKDAFVATAADPYIQHSPDMKDGIDPVWDLVAKRPEGFSSTQMKWLGTDGFLDNGNYLVMLREVDRGDGTPKSKIFDLMYFDEEGKYSEHWDMRQSLSDKTASGRSETEEADVYANAPVSYDVDTEEANKRLVASFLNLAFNGGELKAAMKLYVADDYIQHNPLIPDGVQPVIDAFEAGKLPPLCYDIRFVLAQNDMVWTYSKVTTPDGIAAVVDLIRVRDGKMVEHWDVIQPVPEDAANDNGMF